MARLERAEPRVGLRLEIGRASSLEEADPPPGSELFKENDLASESRRERILDGDRYGGEEGNTHFPEGWSDDKIMKKISDVATDPSLTWVQRTGRLGAEYVRGGGPVR
ncbi:hypothetical protein GCM10009630_06830 [Kribbella jejuensis]